MSEKNSPGHEGPDHHREPRAIGPADGAPESGTEDESSGRRHITQSTGPAQFSRLNSATISLLEMSGPLAEGCILTGSDPVGFAGGQTVLDTGWHICDGITLRVIFTAGESDGLQRQWMESLLFADAFGSPESAAS